MPVINFDEIPDEAHHVEPGTYTAQVARVDEKMTRAGAEMWELVLDLGRDLTIIDRLVFDETKPAAMRRVKLICKALGVDVTKELDLTPLHIFNKRAIVDVVPKEFIGNNGQKIISSEVGFSGWRAINADTDDIPF